MKFLINWLYGEQKNSTSDHELTLPPVEALIFLP